MRFGLIHSDPKAQALPVANPRQRAFHHRCWDEGGPFLWTINRIS